MKAKVCQIGCNEDELLDIPDNWAPVRLEPNEYATPSRKSCTRYVLQRG